MMSTRSSAWRFEQRGERLQLERVLGGEAIALAAPGLLVGDGILASEGHAHLDATRLGDVAAALEPAPGHVVALRPDQREDLVLATVLAHERGRQAEPPSRLQLCGHAEDRRRQKVHLVVDDEAPVLAHEGRRSADARRHATNGR